MSLGGFHAPPCCNNSRRPGRSPKPRKRRCPLECYGCACVLRFSSARCSARCSARPGRPGDTWLLEQSLSFVGSVMRDTADKLGVGASSSDPAAPVPTVASAAPATTPSATTLTHQRKIGFDTLQHRLPWCVMVGKNPFLFSSDFFAGINKKTERPKMVAISSHYKSDLGNLVALQVGSGNDVSRT